MSGARLSLSRAAAQRDQPKPRSRGRYSGGSRFKAVPQVSRHDPRGRLHTQPCAQLPSPNTAIRADPPHCVSRCKKYRQVMQSCRYLSRSRNFPGGQSPASPPFRTRRALQESACEIGQEAFIRFLFSSVFTIAVCTVSTRMRLRLDDCPFGGGLFRRGCGRTSHSDRGEQYRSGDRDDQKIGRAHV